MTMSRSRSSVATSAGSSVVHSRQAAGRLAIGSTSAPSFTRHVRTVLVRQPRAPYGSRAAIASACSRGSARMTHVPSMRSGS